MQINELVNQNIWWKFGKDFWKYDKNLKEVKEDFIEFKRGKLKLKKGNIYIIRGNRQSGKSTYIKQIILKLIGERVDPNSILYISCDRLISRKELRNTVNNFYQNNIDIELLYIFLDEITYLEEWNVELKNLADSNLSKKMVIVATGSNPVKLKEKAERLPGRKAEGNSYLFKPLTFREFVLQIIDRIIPRISSAELVKSLSLLKKRLECISINLENIDYKKINSITHFKEELDYLLNIYFLTGGFPAVINDYLKNKFIGKKEYIRSELYEMLIRIVLGDITKIKRSETITREILGNIIEKYTTRYSYTSLGKNLNIPHQTIIDYLDVLEDSFIIEVFNSFDINKKRLRAKGDKKVYLFDPFIFHSINSYIGGVDGFTFSKESILKNKDKLIEGITASHLIQTQLVPYLKEWKTYCWFFYSSSGKELDFVFKTKNKFIGIESKYKEDVDKKEINIVEGITEYIVLTKNKFERGDKISFIPVSVFLSLIERSPRLL